MSKDKNHQACIRNRILSLQTLRALAFLIIYSGHAELNKWSAGGGVNILDFIGILDDVFAS